MRLTLQDVDGSGDCAIPDATLHPAEGCSFAALRGEASWGLAVLGANLWSQGFPHVHALAVTVSHESLGGSSFTDCQVPDSLPPRAVSGRPGERRREPRSRERQCPARACPRETGQGRRGRHEPQRQRLPCAPPQESKGLGLGFPHTGLGVSGRQRQGTAGPRQLCILARPCLKI